MALIEGTNGNDQRFGRNGNDTIKGFAGDDFLNGLGGSDLVLGGSWNDVLFGFQANDILDGGTGNDDLEGGLGFDTLTGGAGADRFIFRNGPDGSIDIITDFVVADDTIVFEDFGVGNGTLNADAFRIGSLAGDATDRFIYNSATGDLFFDRDGTGAAAQVQIAALSANLAMTNNDIFLIA